MKLITFLISLFLILPQSVLSAPDDEEDRWFTIEVISFSRNKSPQLTEKWPFVPPIGTIEEMSLVPEFSDSSIPTPAEQPSEVEDESLLALDVIPLADEEMELTKQAYSLGRSSSITIQSHQAWHQKGLDKENAPWINLASETETLSGKIQISLARYLHANLDISILNPDWTQPEISYESAPIESIESAPITKQVSFISHRRMRSGELHFIDHPLAGLLIKIERYTLPTEETMPIEETPTIKVNEINPS